MQSNPEEDTRSDQFIAMFNEIDHELRKRTGKFDKNISFSEVSRQFASDSPFWRVHDAKLQTFVQIRNFLVHEKTSSGYLAIPSAGALDHLKRVRNHLLRPTPVLKVFKKDVVSMAPDERLLEVLREVSAKGITHFPVYDGEQLHGLLTSDGLTHWLAGAAMHESLVELGDIAVGEVLKAEDTSVPIVTCVGKATPIEEAFDEFVKNPRLQAVLITDSGSDAETPLGILTTWDVARGVDSSDT